MFESQTFLFFALHGWNVSQCSSPLSKIVLNPLGELFTSWKGGFCAFCNSKFHDRLKADLHANICLKIGLQLAVKLGVAESKNVPFSTLWLKPFSSNRTWKKKPRLHTEFCTTQNFTTCWSPGARAEDRQQAVNIVENARQSHTWQWASGHVRSQAPGLRIDNKPWNFELRKLCVQR